jgi:hypothetical protein
VEVVSDPENDNHNNGELGADLDTEPEDAVAAAAVETAPAPATASTTDPAVNGRTAVDAVAISAPAAAPADSPVIDDEPMGSEPTSSLQRPVFHEPTCINDLRQLMQQRGLSKPIGSVGGVVISSASYRSSAEERRWLQQQARELRYNCCLLLICAHAYAGGRL